MHYITLTLNPTLDIDYRLSGMMNAGGLNRAPTPPVKRFSGKGINISRALRDLLTRGGETAEFLKTETLNENMFNNSTSDTVFLSRGTDGDAMSAALAEEGLSISPVHAGGGVRTNVAILGGDEATEINDPGLAVQEREIAAAADRTTDLMEKYGGEITLFLAGSLPPECDGDIYAKLVRAGKRSGATVVLDCDGDAMRSAVTERPYLVKPNRSELFDYGALCMSEDKLEKYRRALFTPDSGASYIRSAAGEMASLIRDGLGVRVLCTLDSAGSVYAADRLYEAPARKVEAKSFKGAGDSFLAAFMWGVAEMNLSPDTALSFAGDFAAAVISE